MKIFNYKFVSSSTKHIILYGILLVIIGLILKWRLNEWGVMPWPYGTYQEPSIIERSVP